MPITSPAVPRPPKKPSADDQLARVTFMLETDTLRDVDATAERLSKDDPLGRTLTRTDVLRFAVREGLKALARGKSK